MCGLSTILWQHCFLSRNNVIKLLIEWRNMPLAVYGILFLKGFSLLKLIHFRMERSSDISKARTVRFSLCIPFFQGGRRISRSLAIPMNRQMMVINYAGSVYPIISAFQTSTIWWLCFLPGAEKSLTLIAVDSFLELLPRSHISYLSAP